LSVTFLLSLRFAIVLKGENGYGQRILACDVEKIKRAIDFLPHGKR